MIAIINGQEHAHEAANLAELMVQLGYEGDWLATSVNGEFVHRQERDHFVLGDRDRVEILAPMQGG